MMEIYWQPPSDRKDCGYSSGSFYSTNLRVLSHLVGPLNRLDQGDSSPHSSTGQKKKETQMQIPAGRIGPLGRSLLKYCRVIDEQTVRTGKHSKHEQNSNKRISLSLFPLRGDHLSTQRPISVCADGRCWNQQNAKRSASAEC